MNARLALGVAVVLLSALALACDDDDNGDPANGANGNVDGATATSVPANGADTSPAPPGAATPTLELPEPPEGTPTTFDERRAALLDELDAIGVSIGAVPDDVRAELLAACEALSEGADEDDVASICQSLAQAFEDGDPGRLDLVLQELAVLEGD